MRSDEDAGAVQPWRRQVHGLASIRIQVTSDEQTQANAVVPDLVMRMKAADYFASKDLVLQAALRGTLPK